MRRLYWIALCLVVLAGCSETPKGSYGVNQPIVDGDLIFISDQRITNLAGATALTVPANTKVIWVSIDAQNVRYRHGVPTAAIGHQLCAGAQLNYTASLATLQFIEEAPGAILFVSYFRY